MINKGGRTKHKWTSQSRNVKKGKKTARKYMGRNHPKTEEYKVTTRKNGTSQYPFKTVRLPRSWFKIKKE